jgi:hypothetical protein
MQSIRRVNSRAQGAIRTQIGFKRGPGKFPSTDLERQDLAAFPVEGDDLGVEHEARHAFPHHVGDDGEHVGVLARVVLRVAAEDLERAILRAVDLAPLPVVLVLAREGLVREAIQHLADPLGRVREHGLYRDARPEEALGRQLLERSTQQLRDDAVVARQLAEHLLDDLHGAVQGLLSAGGAGRGAHGRAQGHGVGKGNQDRLLGQADAHLALQMPHDVLGLGALAGDEECFDFVLLLGAGVLARHAGDLQERFEDALHSQRFSCEHGTLCAS